MSSTKTIAINILFPIVDLGNVTYRYRKVKKVSAPGYMLLVYIFNGEKTGHQTLGECLMEAGIDTRVFDIFSEELYDLIEKYKVVTCTEFFEGASGLNQIMPTLRMESLKITREGEILFRDQYIYDGDIETKRQWLLYNPIEHTFLFGVPQNKPTNDDKGIFPPQAFDKEKEYPNKENVECYLNSIKDKLKLDKQELIVDVELGNKEIVFQKKKINIEISTDGASFVCDNSKYLEYLTDKFDSAWLDAIILNEKECLGIDGLPIVQISMIKNYSRILTKRELPEFKKCQYIIGSNKLKIKATGKADIVSDDIGKGMCKEIAPTCDLIIVKEDGQIMSYEPLILEVKPVGNKGNTFHLQAVIEREQIGDVKDSLIQKISDAVEANIKSQDINDIVWVVRQTENNKLLSERISLSANPVDQIPVLSSINRCMNGFSLWKDWYKSYANEIIDKIITSVTLDNIAYKYELVNEMSSKIGMTDNMVLDRLMGALPNDVTNEQRYDVLDKMKVSEHIKLAFVNVVPDYLQKVISGKYNEILREDSLADKFKRIGNSLSELKALTGINDDPANFTAKNIEHIIDFKQKVQFFSTQYKNLWNEYEKYAPDEFNRLKRLLDAIDDICRLYPNKEIKDFAKDDFLNMAKKDKRHCIADLQTRLEIELRLLLGHDSETSKKALDEASDTKKISEKDYMQLEEMREKRNNSLHYGKDDYDGLDLQECINAVFRIVEQNKPRVAERKQKKR